MLLSSCSHTGGLGAGNSHYKSFFTVRKSLSSYRRQAHNDGKRVAGGGGGGGGGGRGDRCRVWGQLPIFSGVLMNMPTTRLFPQVSSRIPSLVWKVSSKSRSGNVDSVATMVIF